MHHHHETMAKFDFGPIEALAEAPPAPPEPIVHALYEELSAEWQYVVADPTSKCAVIIDPHLDNGPSATDITTIAADRILAVVQQNGYFVERILHTHEPTKHPSSAWYLRTQLMQATGSAPRVQIGKTMAAVQRVFRRKYSMNDGSTWRTDFENNGFSDGQTFNIGNVSATVLHLKGRMAFIVGRHIFAGHSKFDLEIRNNQDRLLGDLNDYIIYTAEDPPPKRTAKLEPIFERSVKGPQASRKLVIKYAVD